MTNKVIVTLPDHGLESVSQIKRCKHWLKRVDSVNTAVATGYAFTGSFADFEATVEVPSGTYYLSYVEDRSANLHLREIEVRLYVVDPVGAVKLVDEWSPTTKGGWALDVRDEIAAYVNAPKPATEVQPEQGVTLAHVAALVEISRIAAGADFSAVKVEKIKCILDKIPAFRPETAG